jgi:hypothetical protein
MTGTRNVWFSLAELRLYLREHGITKIDPYEAHRMSVGHATRARLPSMPVVAYGLCCWEMARTGNEHTAVCTGGKRRLRARNPRLEQPTKPAADDEPEVVWDDS